MPPTPANLFVKQNADRELVCLTPNALLRSGVLYSDLHGWDPDIWEPHAVWGNLTATDSLYTNAADCILCSVVTVIVMPCMGLLAISFGKLSEDGEEGFTAEQAQAAGSAARMAGAATGRGVNGGHQPLLSADALGGGELQASAGVSETVRKALEREAQQVHHNRLLHLHKGVIWRQSVVTGFLLVISSALQLFIGIKCIGFKFTDEATQGWLMGLGVLWINIMSWSVCEVRHVPPLPSSPYPCRMSHVLGELSLALQAADLALTGPCSDRWRRAQ